MICRNFFLNNWMRHHWKHDKCLHASYYMLRMLLSLFWFFFPIMPVIKVHGSHFRFPEHWFLSLIDLSIQWEANDLEMDKVSLFVQGPADSWNCWGNSWVWDIKSLHQWPFITWSIGACFELWTELRWVRVQFNRMSWQ